MDNYFQCGVIEGTVSISLDTKIVFPEPFAELPLVFLQLNVVQSGNSVWSAVVEMVNEKEAAIRLQRISQVGYESVPYKLNWLAIGI